MLLAPNHSAIFLLARAHALALLHLLSWLLDLFDLFAFLAFFVLCCCCCCLICLPVCLHVLIHYFIFLPQHNPRPFFCTYIPAASFYSCLAALFFVLASPLPRCFCCCVRVTHTHIHALRSWLGSWSRLGSFMFSRLGSCSPCVLMPLRV